MASSFGGTIKLKGESEYRKALSNINDNLKVLSSEMKVVSSRYDDNDKSAAKLNSTNGVLVKQIKEQEDKVILLAAALSKAKEETGENSATSKKWQTQLNNAEAELNNLNKELNENGKELDESSQKTLKLGDIIKANLISDAIKSGLGALTDAFKKLSSAVVDVGKAALDSYADYEQLSGGVETMFGKSSDKVKEYADEAYKTAGLSANEYMETVTGFSASLLQSLGGNTDKAADVANMALIDMSDNANKFGTDMESLQNAYQGFAKQNYTMLDNLKLGYGGTKSEMERLLQDAEKLSGVKYDISNLSDVYNAIHVVQKEMGVTGTTAKESSTTIQGAAQSMKSSWNNLLTGLATGNGNVEKLFNNFLETIVGNESGEGGILSNIIPRIEIIFESLLDILPTAIESLLPVVMDTVGELINTLIDNLNEHMPSLLNSAALILQTLLDGITNNLGNIMPVVMGIINTLATFLIQNLPTIIQAGIDILLGLINGLTSMIPSLIPVAVNAILEIATTLIDNLDKIIDAGIDLIFALIEGITDSLPVLIDKMPEIIAKLVVALYNNFPKLVDAAFKIPLKLAEGIMNAVPDLLEKIPTIIAKMVVKLKEGISDIFNVGKDLISGLWNGITDKWDSLKDKVKNFGSGIVKKFKSVFGIHSPSTVFRDEIGNNLALGIEEGFTDKMDSVADSMASAIPTSFDTSLNTDINSSAGNIGAIDTMYDTFVEALKNMKVVMNGREMGNFVIDTVQEVVYL